MHPYFIQNPMGSPTICLDVPEKVEMSKNNNQGNDYQQKVPVIVNNVDDFQALVDSMFV